MPKQSRGTLSVLLPRFEGGPSNGQVGLVLSPTGVGKSLVLVHAGLDAILDGRKTLHIAVSDDVAQVRNRYDELYRVVVAPRVDDPAAAMVAAERRRMIHSFREKEFTLDAVRANLVMLRDMADFSPEVLVLDGSDSSVLRGLSELATEFNLSVWASLVDDGHGEITADWAPYVQFALRLEPRGTDVAVDLCTADGCERMDAVLDAGTLAPLSLLSSIRAEAPLASASDCTVFSGGAKGSEAAFGEAAARVGATECHFTFEGHRQARTEGSVTLSEEELASGDVSLVYVSRRLHREYNQSGLIRKVLQTLWHMVSRARQVFVIGAIQDDNTVVGGTGWSVELARMWNRDLWVFDQDKGAWFRWSGSEWVTGEPRITERKICGTGTRYLTDQGRGAIDALFARSFAVENSGD